MQAPPPAWDSASYQLEIACRAVLNEVEIRSSLRENRRPIDSHRTRPRIHDLVHSAGRLHKCLASLKCAHAAATAFRCQVLLDQVTANHHHVRCALVKVP